jgi:hypothetical protein
MWRLVEGLEKLMIKTHDEAKKFGFLGLYLTEIRFVAEK